MKFKKNIFKNKFTLAPKKLKIFGINLKYLYYLYTKL